MCEALVRVVNQTSTDAYKDVKLTKQGHVIVLQEDGWNWSTQERTASFWRIISVPGVPVSQVVDLLDSELANRIKANPLDPKANEKTNPMLQVRAWAIDASLLPTAVRNALAAPRTGTGILTATKAQVVAAKKKYTARADPSVVG